jgi:hypothetical protein
MVSVSLTQLLVETIETVDLQDWKQHVANLDHVQRKHLLERWNRLGGVVNLQEEESRKRNPPEPQGSVTTTSEGPIPCEVLRQVLPFLTARDVGKLSLLTSPRMTQALGEEIIWKDICQKMWPKSHISTTTDYRWYFRQRQKPIALASDTLQPLPPPRALPNSDCWHLVLDVWNPQKQLVVSQRISSIDLLHKFVARATLTVPLEKPIEVGRLPRSNFSPCWDLPKFHEGWRARLDWIRTDIHKSNVLLETDFAWWKGWSQMGELTFLQRQRTRGLELTDRGHALQHRIVRSAARGSQWQGYLGLQFKVVLICEKRKSEETTSLVPFDFTKIRIEAIRLHENSIGDIQHNLFRKDPGWQHHGVELLHLLEKLC